MFGVGKVDNWFPKYGVKLNFSYLFRQHIQYISSFDFYLLLEIEPIIKIC